jgi:hypothetical protein
MLNRFAEETAIGIITCNRVDYVKQLLNSIDPSVGSIYLINAGDPFSMNLEDIETFDKITKYIKTEKSPTPVGIAKNAALRNMRHDGFKYLFLIEDDVKIKNNKVFEKYIETAADSGLWAGQLSYGTHGGTVGGNVKGDGTPNVIDSVKYDLHSVDLYPQGLQAFTLYHANVIKLIGYMDEYYVNAGEHLDHYYAAFLKGIGNYFWYFPDIENSSDYLEDIDSGHSGSIIRSSNKWKDNQKKAWAWFRRKYNYFPTQIPQSSKDKILARLEFIEKNYAKKDLINE